MVSEAVVVERERAKSLAATLRLDRQLSDDDDEVES